MPTATETARIETRSMRLLSRVLGRSGPLSRFLAARRVPGSQWQPWELIAIELRDKTGELVSREGLHKMAVRYGIPDTVRSDDEAEYFTAVRAAGIKI